MYFLNINKPKGITSFDVIRQLRKILKIKQIGHSGTLDPLASGVLQVAVGNACKLLDFLESDKEYVADIKFGYSSDTYDEEGAKEFIQTPTFSEKQLKNTLNEFIGITEQIPPKYSAIKINGKKLCDIARKDSDFNIKIKPRKIEIYTIDLLSFKEDEAKIKVFCKKGTYIRSLVNDIGEKLGCGAYLTDLKRTKAGNFLIENSDNLENMNYKKLSPLEVLNLEKKELTDEEYLKIKNGNFIENKDNFKTQQILLTKNYKLVSLGILSDNLIKPKKNFNEE